MERFEKIKSANMKDVSKLIIQKKMISLFETMLDNKHHVYKILRSAGINDLEIVKDIIALQKTLEGLKNGQKEI